MAILVHNYAQNYIKKNSDHAQKITYIMSGEDLPAYYATGPFEGWTPP